MDQQSFALLDYAALGQSGLSARGPRTAGAPQLADVLGDYVARIDRLRQATPSQRPLMCSKLAAVPEAANQDGCTPPI